MPNAAAMMALWAAPVLAMTHWKAALAVLPSSLGWRVRAPSKPSSYHPACDDAIVAARKMLGPSPGLIMVADESGQISQIIRHAGDTT